MSAELEAALLGAAQLGCVIVAAPLLQGFVRKIKARLQYRSGPPLLQSYHDLAKLFARAETVAASASVVQFAAPWVVLASTLAAVLFVPAFSAVTPLTRDGDLFVVIGLFALGRAALTLGGIDSGSSFGQMGSSRELAVGALVEPALMLALAALALTTGTTRLGEIVAAGDDKGLAFLGLPWALALVALGIVTLAETGRIPVDNPDTHLELTMTHEAMLLEYSGRSLGVLHFATMVRQLLLGVLIASLFFPFGLATEPALSDYAVGFVMLAGKLVLFGVALAVVEMSFAKMRLFELPDLLGSASLAALVAMGIAVWQV